MFTYYWLIMIIKGILYNILINSRTYCKVLGHVIINSKMTQKVKYSYFLENRVYNYVIYIAQHFLVFYYLVLLTILPNKVVIYFN